MTDQFIRERTYLKGVSPKTLAWYRDSFKAFENALDSKAAIIDRIAALRQRGVKAVSINTYLRCINAYFLWLHTEHGKERLRIPRLKEEQKVLATLSTEQVKRLIQYKPKGQNLTRAHVFSLLVLDTGLRCTEALSLPWDKVNFDSLVLTVLGKGNKQRVVPFSFECRKVLFRWKQKQSAELVFATKNRTPTSARNMERDLGVLAKKADITGVRFSPHSLRHTMAVSWIRNGGDIYMLQRILGHSSISTTTIYLKSLGVDDIRNVHSRISILTQVKGSV